MSHSLTNSVVVYSIEYKTLNQATYSMAWLHKFQFLLHSAISNEIQIHWVVHHIHNAPFMLQPSLLFSVSCFYFPFAIRGDHAHMVFILVSFDRFIMCNGKRKSFDYTAQTSPKFPKHFSSGNSTHSWTNLASELDTNY